jgi:hypothetical protein
MTVFQWIDFLDVTGRELKDFEGDAWTFQSELRGRHYRG